jgi:L-ribulose-5-phosphate 3-epimerase
MQIKDRIGFMQGRLSAPVNGRIQAFPARSWRDEFALAESIDIRIMEWTLDHDGIYDNPILTISGQREIENLRSRHKIQIPSLTGDFFMQAPFYKVEGKERVARIEEMKAVIEACSHFGVQYVCMPLVDDGRVENEEQEANLLDGLGDISELLRSANVMIVFESDNDPVSYKKFLDKLDSDLFGVNFDIGNSAALGNCIEEEISLYGERIFNVHVKDRIFKGTTVALGTGDANLPVAIRALEQHGYTGNYILQTARAADGNHVKAIEAYATMTHEWIEAAK